MKCRIWYQNKYYLYDSGWQPASELDNTIRTCDTSGIAWQTCAELEKKYPMYRFRFDYED